MKACLNGAKRRADHEAAPATPQELATDARAAAAAGVAALHVHPRGVDEAETLDPAACGAAITAIRAACPGIPVGLSTAAWIAPDPRARVALIESWTVFPEFASVNFSEPGTAEVCAALSRSGIGIEAGLWSVEDARRLIASGLAPLCLRILVEAQQLARLRGGRRSRGGDRRGARRGGDPAAAGPSWGRPGDLGGAGCRARPWSRYPHWTGGYPAPIRRATCPGQRGARRRGRADGTPPRPSPSATP